MIEIAVKISHRKSRALQSTKVQCPDENRGLFFLKGMIVTLKTVIILTTVIPYVIAIIIFIFGARKCRNTIIEWDEMDESYKHIRIERGKGRIVGLGVSGSF